MATIPENLKFWNEEYDWPSEGDEWSAQFGGTEAMWWFVIYPRIHQFLPAGKILEIAPGYGRWTQFLRLYCHSLVAVDLSEKCIEHCKRRFAGDNQVEFHVNDGRSLSVVPDGSIDLVFSFDSLVHVHKDVVEAYLAELARKLKPNGLGLVHHSNLGAYPVRLGVKRYYDRLPRFIRRNLVTEDIVEKGLSINLRGGRAASMTGPLFREYCRRVGLECVGQELISWGRGRCLTDGISIFARAESEWGGRGAYLENSEFSENAGLISRLAKLYCGWRGTYPSVS